MTRRRALGALGALAAGVAGLGAALRGAAGPAPAPRVASGTARRREAYGDDPRQVGEWWVPPGASDTLPVVVLVHGGYWRAAFDLTLEDAVAADLAGRGFLVWNIDYRPSDHPWPTTLLDVAAAYDHLTTDDRVDPARISVVGHSAGGHLALWLASRHRLPEGAPGAGSAAPRPAAVVAQSPVAALAEGARRRLGDGGDAVQSLMDGEPDEVPERYAVSDPLALLPTGIRTTCVHSPGDDIVPISQSESYVAAAGSATRLVRVPGGHFEHLNPGSEACEAMRRALA
jgi:acetyl esterase/lipase